MAEVKSVKGMVMNQGKMLKSHDQNLSLINARHEKIDIGKAAVEEFKNDENKKKRERILDETNRTKLKLLRDLAPLIVAATALAYAIATKYH